jgi:hypothetical protein
MFFLLLIVSLFVVLYAPAGRTLNRLVAGLVFESRKAYR